PLRVLALTETGLGALALTLPVDRVDADDLDTEDLLDRDLDLGLVGVRVHQEGVHVLFKKAVALLGDHRRQQNVARIGNHLPSSSLTRATWDPVWTSDSVAEAFADRPLGAP